MLDFIQTFFRELVAAFALLMVSGVVLWMVFVVIALFRELFRPADIHIRSYLYRIWRLLLLSFELVAYGGIFVAMFLLKSTEDEQLRFTLMLIQSILLSILFLYLRWKMGGFFFQQKHNRR